MKKFGEVAYALALPPELEHVHNVFHVSVLRPYKEGYKHVIDFGPIEIQKDLSYEEVPVQIVDRKEQVLRNKVIALVKLI